ncbi:MAG: hypothetical protein ACI9BV_000864 [Rhodothermales bacterium]
MSWSPSSSPVEVAGLQELSAQARMIVRVRTVWVYLS